MINFPNIEYAKLEAVLDAATHLASGVVLCMPCQECEDNANKVLKLVKELDDEMAKDS